MTQFTELLSLDVSAKVDKKKTGKATLSYLSWAYAWGEFCKAYPDATYIIQKNEENHLPYFSDNRSGAMCYTTVTAGGITHEMWLPIMDGANKPMREAGYIYHVKNKGKWDNNQRCYVLAPNEPEFIEKTVEPFNMFDVNKTVMRCLVKNLAMFGLGLYIYAGEDVPSDVVDPLTTPIYYINIIGLRLGEIMNNGVAKEHIVNSLFKHLKVTNLRHSTDVEALKKYHNDIITGNSSLVKKEHELIEAAELKEKELAEKDLKDEISPEEIEAANASEEAAIAEIAAKAENSE